MRVISLLVLSSLFFISSCQSTVNFSGTICVLDFSMSTMINRLDDEGDAELSIRLGDEETMQNIEFLQSNLQKAYERLKDTMTTESTRLLEPYDLLNDQEYLDHQNFLDGSLSSTKFIYRPRQFQPIKDRPLTKWRNFGLTNNCDQVLRIQSHWVQVPNYQFLKKTTYFLGIQYRMELLDIKSSKLANKEFISKGSKPLESRWMLLTIEDFALNMKKQLILGDVFDTLVNDLKYLSEKR